jgi:hypothetical protein
MYNVMEAIKVTGFGTLAFFVYLAIGRILSAIDYRIELKLKPHSTQPEDTAMWMMAWPIFMFVVLPSMGLAWIIKKILMLPEYEDGPDW